MSKRNPKPNGIKSAKTFGTFSLFVETIAGAAQKVFGMVMRMVSKEKEGSTASTKPTVTLIDGEPAKTWNLGCSASAEGMIAAYNDKQYPNLFEGDMPLDDSSMPTITDVIGDIYKLNPSVASEDTFRDYWISYNSTVPDPYLGTSSTAIPAPDAIGASTNRCMTRWTIFISKLAHRLFHKECDKKHL